MHHAGQLAIEAYCERRLSSRVIFLIEPEQTTAARMGDAVLPRVEIPGEGVKVTVSILHVLQTIAAAR